MRVIQVVPDVYAESAGPAYSVPASAVGLIENGVDAEVYAVGRMAERKWDCPIRTFPQAKLAGAITGRSPALLNALKDAAQTADIIHTNSIWKFPNVYQDWAVRGTKCKTVIGPRGTVSKWALSRSRLKKFIFGHLWQYPAMRAADMFVASCQEEADDIRRLGYKQPIAIVPNGIDIPEKIPAEKALRRRMYFLSRIHPKKNVELLIRCWAKLEDRFPDWDLSIVGPDKGNPYADAMKKLAKDRGCRRVTFEGEIKGEAKHRFVAASECLVLPTHSENFGMVVAESLAVGTPAICSTGAPWLGLKENGCGWWVSATEEDFMTAMTEAMSKSRAELVAMGLRGREWMSRDFTWTGIGAKLKSAYEWLLYGGDKPSHVYLHSDAAD